MLTRTEDNFPPSTQCPESLSLAGFQVITPGRFWVFTKGYSYSRFCELYQRWNRNQDVVLRQEHHAGEKTFVDWAGDTVPIHDRESGETAPASIFVAVLGASTYTFARAALGQGLANWIDCHVRAFDFFQGTTKLLVPDNPRTGVTRACRYEPDLNRTYHEMAQHYGIAVLPARPRKPRDKAKVENAVGVVERWILAALRHRKFSAVAELNEAIEELLERLNLRPFRKREGTRASLFESIDRPALQPLPAQRYLLAEWKTVRANIDYHVEIDRHYYSVPYQLAGQQLEARYTATTIEVFHGGKRVSSHARSSAAYRHRTGERETTTRQSKEFSSWHPPVRSAVAHRLHRLDPVQSVRRVLAGEEHDIGIGSACRNTTFAGTKIILNSHSTLAAIEPPDPS